MNVSDTKIFCRNISFTRSSIAQPAGRSSVSYILIYAFREEDYAEVNKSYFPTSRAEARRLFFHCIMEYVRG